MWPFYPLLWSKYSTSSSVLFRGISSIYTCTFAVSIGRCEFRTFLCQYLELPPQVRYFFFKCYSCFLNFTVNCEGHFHRYICHMHKKLTFKQHYRFPDILHALVYQFNSFIQLCSTLCDPMDYSVPGFLIHHPELTQAHVCLVGDAIQPFIPSHLLLLLLSVFSNIRIFSNELAFCLRWPKYWSFNFSISPSNE